MGPQGRKEEKHVKFPSTKDISVTVTAVTISSSVTLFLITNWLFICSIDIIEYSDSNLWLTVTLVQLPNGVILNSLLNDILAL